MAKRILVALATLAISMLALAPSGAGSALVSKTVLTAPYKNATLSDFNSGVFINGCSTVGFPVSPHFYPSIGKAAVALNASSPACANRAGKLPSSVATGVNVFKGGIRFLAPATGNGTVVMNLTITWRESWNLTIPTCMDNGTRSTYQCALWAYTSIQGGGLLTYSNLRLIPRLTQNASWSPAPPVENHGWRDWCTGTANITCHPGPKAPIFGSVHGTSTLLWSFSGQFNSSRNYLASFSFGLYFGSQSDQTNGGTMVGGTALAVASVSVQLNSITIT